MIVYRGIKNVLMSQVDPLFRNEDVDHLVYGRGTSYSVEREYAEDYCKFGRGLKWGWILVYDFTPKNLFQVYESNYEDLDEIDKNMIIDEETFPTKNLCDVLSNKGYDSALFAYDEFDPHILLLDKCDPTQLELKEAYLFVETQELVDKLKPFKMGFDGEFFLVPPSLFSQVDEILKSI